MLFLILWSIITSAIITYLITPYVIKIALRFQLVDNPKIRPHPAHTHQGIIPRAGGLAIFIGIFWPLVLLYPQMKQIIGIFIASVILIAVGLWDDRKDRSPYLRFFTNCLAAVIVVSSGVTIPYITNPFGGILPLSPGAGNLLAFIWIIWTTNIIGWSGGVDGQLPGFVSIAAVIIGLLSLRFALLDPQQLPVLVLSFLTAGAFLGFLPWNYYPQKIMPGYGGKTLAGFLLAILSIMAFSKLGTALLVLAMPMTDAVFMLFKRIVSHKSPVRATREHLHHHLLRLGWGKRKIAVFYWLITAAFGIFALMLNSKQKVFVTILVMVIIVGFIFWVNLIRKLPDEKELSN